MDTVAHAPAAPQHPHKAVPVAHSTRDEHKIDNTIVGIALFKIAKGLLFLVLAAAALRLWRHDINESAHYWMRLLGIKQESRLMHEFLTSAGPTIDSWRRLISPLLFFYAGIFFTEGGGLLARKSWAEYFTIIVTASLIPLEIYEMFVHPNWLKAGMLLVNSVIVWFLVMHTVKMRSARLGKYHPGKLPKLSRAEPS